MSCSDCDLRFDDVREPWAIEPQQFWLEDAARCQRRYYWRHVVGLAPLAPDRDLHERLLTAAARAWRRSFYQLEALTVTGEPPGAPFYKALPPVLELADRDFDAVIGHATKLGASLNGVDDAFFESCAHLKQHLRERARGLWWSECRREGSTERTVAGPLALTLTLPPAISGRPLLPHDRPYSVVLDRVFGAHGAYFVDVTVVTGRASALELARGIRHYDHGKATVFAARLLAESLSLLDNQASPARAIAPRAIRGARYSILRTLPPFTSMGTPEAPFAMRQEFYDQEELLEWYERTRHFRADLSARTTELTLGDGVSSRWPVAEYPDGPCTRPWPCAYRAACSAIAASDSEGWADVYAPTGALTDGK